MSALCSLVFTTGGDPCVTDPIIIIIIIINEYD